MASKQKTDESYFAHALSHLVIDMDEIGAFAKVPSQARPKECYKVRIDESDPRNVHAVSCSCPARKPCKHMVIVSRFYYRILRHYQPATSVGEAMTAATEQLAASYSEAHAAYLIGDAYKAAPSKNDREEEYTRYRSYEMQIGA